MQQEQIKVGDKLTVFKLSDFMACTVKSELVLKGISDDGRLMFGDRYKQGLRYLSASDETYIFRGWNLAIITDQENQTAPHVDRSNACFKFSSRDNKLTAEELKRYIQERQLNPELSRRARAFSLFIDKDGEPSLLFPELVSLYESAIIDKIMAPQAVEA